MDNIIILLQDFKCHCSDLQMYITNKDSIVKSIRKPIHQLFLKNTIYKIKDYFEYTTEVLLPQLKPEVILYILKVLLT
jgi:hypothetical protein